MLLPYRDVRPVTVTHWRHERRGAETCLGLTTKSQRKANRPQIPARMEVTKDADKKSVASRNDSAQDDFADTPWIVRVPLRLCADFVSSGFRLVRPYAPQLVPLAVFVCAIPALLFFSLSSGWYVWRSIAVGWEVPLYLQFGCVKSPSSC